MERIPLEKRTMQFVGWNRGHAIKHIQLLQESCCLAFRRTRVRTYDHCFVPIVLLIIARTSRQRLENGSIMNRTKRSENGRYCYG